VNEPDIKKKPKKDIFPDHIPTMNILLERPIPEVNLKSIYWGQIPPKQLTGGNLVL